MRVSWIVGSTALIALFGLSGATGAAAQSAPPPAASATVAPAAGRLSLKRRIAIGRFSNSTHYGRALLFPGEADPLASQAADMLAARLVESGQFIVIERRDLDEAGRPQAQTPDAPSGVLMADTILVGSVTQFGRRLEGKSGFLSSHAHQMASATVQVRLIDARTHQAFFSTEGSGEAGVEASEVAGFGSHAAYDSSLNDKAIAAAIADLMSNVMQKLEAQPWSTDVLEASGATVMLSGGSGEGLRLGDQLSVARRGRTVTSQQTGGAIELPSEKIATIEITGFFGMGQAEGATARVIAGRVDGDVGQLKVMNP